MNMQIVILGQGLWLQVAAALVASQLRPWGVRCTAVEVPGEPEPGSVASGPELHGLCRLLGQSWQELLLKARGSFNLGTDYRDALTHQAAGAAGPARWFVPFGHLGLKSEAAEFAQGLFSYLAGQAEQGPEPYCLAALAAWQGKFAVPPANRTDLRDMLDFGLHLDRQGLCAWLRRFSERQGVRFVAADALFSAQTAQGPIASVQLAGGESLPVDFCLDCRPRTGVKSGAVMLQLFAGDPQQGPGKPCTSAERVPWGWLVRHPLANGCVWQTEFDPQVQKRDQVQAWLDGNLGALDWQLRSRQTSSPDEVWTGNCLQLGPVVETLDSPLLGAMGPLQALLVSWLDMLPNQASCPATARLFNGYWQQYREELNTYLTLHETPLETHTGRLFARLGRVPTAETDAVRPVQLMTMLYGLGLRPELPSRLLLDNEPAQVGAALAQIRRRLDTLVTNMPSHAQTLARCLDGRPAHPSY
ncbi:tryptophan 7-halogenase [Bowmanella dokdonensis]|uniref:Tryptophan 7-halogenase n=1 Tax=Bowmanella dokdonensis TaxID=751969 RepID=A0A939IP86_9ALTE|nr:tryptophan 7-halogenase [Bowmanella dokdonensis]MBN7825645.1 tryptophan 7-halogenase [Bowmanella dokdonensis]